MKRYTIHLIERGLKKVEDWKDQLKNVKKTLSHTEKHKGKFVVGHKWKSQAGEFSDNLRKWDNENDARSHMQRLLRQHGMEEKELIGLVNSTIKYAKANSNGRIFKQNKPFFYEVSLQVRR